MGQKIALLRERTATFNVIQVMLNIVPPVLYETEQNVKSEKREIIFNLQYEYVLKAQDQQLVL